MRTLILSLLLCCAASATQFTNPVPDVFDSTAALQKWADSSWLGTKHTDLTYKKHKLAVYFCWHTSGVVTTEPYVFVERDGHWVRVLNATVCPFEMTATIEGDDLVLWRLEPSKDDKRKAEFLRLNLANLDTV